MRITIIPCLALYPNLRARAILLGFSTLVMAFSFLQITALCLNSIGFSFNIFNHT
uniref:Uncharacterized protein n=1 Tax=uncultured marine thaumarchaeote KM3_56_D04 TaxID=1456203 RepID=A0A075H9F0_9ARCH|nr:hypothetical protein [uncultured marine thaumarchaeote KM3_56_D04]